MRNRCFRSRDATNYLQLVHHDVATIIDARQKPSMWHGRLLSSVTWAHGGRGPKWQLPWVLWFFLWLFYYFLKVNQYKLRPVSVILWTVTNQCEYRVATKSSGTFIFSYLINDPMYSPRQFCKTRSPTSFIEFKDLAFRNLWIWHLISWQYWGCNLNAWSLEVFKSCCCSEIWKLERNEH